MPIPIKDLIEHSLWPWVRPDVLNIAVNAVLADLRTENYHIVRDDEATIERMADELWELANHGQGAEVTMGEQARVALNAALRGEDD